MAAPTAYTESELAAFMVNMLSQVAGVLGWTGLVDLQTAVDETLLAYGVDDVAQATDIRKLRALGRREAWRAAMQATTADFDFSADGGRYDRSQVHAQAAAMFQQAEVDALTFDDGYVVAADRLIPIHDPYTVIIDDEDRTYP